MYVYARAVTGIEREQRKTTEAPIFLGQLLAFATGSTDYLRAGGGEAALLISHRSAARGGLVLLVEACLGSKGGGYLHS